MMCVTVFFSFNVARVLARKSPRVVPGSHNSEKYVFSTTTPPTYHDNNNIIAVISSRRAKHTHTHIGARTLLTVVSLRFSAGALLTKVYIIYLYEYI